MAITVTPAASFSTTGFLGNFGSFSPSQVSYTITAASGAVGWVLAEVPDWLSASAYGGVVGVGGTTVTLTVNGNAGAYGAGLETDYIQFYNQNNGSGGVVLPAQLNVLVGLSLASTASSVTQVGQPYSQTNVANGGTAPYAYSVSSGVLPAGTQLDASTGAVTGTPTAYGAFSYAIEAADSGSPTQTSTEVVGGTIAPATLTLASTASPTTQVGQPYAQINAATGGATPLTYSVANGVLPYGASLDAATGLVSGSPTAAGGFYYTIEVTDASSPPQVATQVSTGAIAPALLTLTSTASGATQVGQVYSQTNAASGGTTPYSYSVSSGAPPAGVALNASSGTASGTPTAAGAFSYTIKAIDSGLPTPQTATQLVGGAVAPATLTLTSTVSATTQVGRPYAQANLASGGTPPYAYSISAGALPTGVALNAATGAASGTPTTSGAFGYTVKATDGGLPTPQTATQVVSGAMSPATLTLASTASPTKQVGQAYTQSNVASGGTPPYAYSVFAGLPPAGVALDASTGAVTGTPTAYGAFNYSIEATDSGVPAQTVTQDVGGTISSAVLTLASTASTATRVGQPYAQANVASGGTTPYAYSVSAGALPAGTALGPTTGAVSGTPTAAVAFSYTIKATDGGAPARTATQVSSGAIAPAMLTLASTASATTEVGQPYAQVNVASGGATPYSYSVSAGALPAGVKLSAATGVASGAPTAAGAFSYTIEVEDSGVPTPQTATQASSGTIAPAPLTLASTASKAAQVGKPYSQTNVASGGVKPYAYSVFAGLLPAGVALNAATGAVTGTPTAHGAFNYAIEASDSGAPARTATQDLGGAIVPAVLTLVSSASTAKQAGQAYAQTNVASGGVAPYAFSIAAGSLPTGVTLDAATGLASGAPTSAGAFGYTVEATDSGGPAQTATRVVSGTIAPAALALTATASAATQVGQVYAQTNVASGGTPPYAFAVASGAPPAGVKLNASTGTAAGTPTASGAFGYTIKVSDSGKPTRQATTQMVSGAIAPSTLTLVSTASVVARVGRAYSQSNVARGGTAPYAYSVAAGLLPTGVTLNATTGAVSGTPAAAGAFNYAIAATDGGAPRQTASQDLGGAIAPPLLTLASTASTFMQVGRAYAQTNVAGGGTPPYAYSLSAGSLPAGVALSAATGVVAGTPTVAGAFGYTIGATDSGAPTPQRATHVTSGAIAAAALTLASTPSATTQVGRAFAQANVASGGVAPYAFSVSGGALPAGVALNPKTGTAVGTPTRSGAFGYTIAVTDDDRPARTARAAFGGLVTPAPKAVPPVAPPSSPTPAAHPAPVYEGAAFVTARDGGASDACASNGIFAGAGYTLLYRPYAEPGKDAGIGFRSRHASMRLDLPGGASLPAGHGQYAVVAKGQSSAVGPFAINSTFALDIAPDPLSETPWVTLSGTVANMWGVRGCSVTLRGSLTLRP